MIMCCCCCVTIIVTVQEWLVVNQIPCNGLFYKVIIYLFHVDHLHSCCTISTIHVIDEHHLKCYSLISGHQFDG